MGLKEDLQIYLEEQEQRKTSFGGLQQQSQLGYLPWEEYEETYGPPQSQRNMLVDAVGQGLWSLADEALFGLPGIVAEKTFGEEVTEEYLTPQTFAGKTASAVGGLVGFVKGPLALGNIAVKTAFRGGKQLKTAEKAVKGLQIGGDPSKRAITEALVDVNIANRLRGLQNTAKMNADIALNKGFRKAAFSQIDEGVETLVKGGVISAEEGLSIAKIYKKQFMHRPVDDFMDLITKMIPGQKGYAIGRMIHEATVFGAIDGIHEGFSAYGRGHDYDYMAPVWGTMIGAGFGMMSFWKPRGKGSDTKTDFMQGLKGVFNAPVKGELGTLVKRAKWLGDDLERVGRHVKTYKGREVDLRNIESYVATMPKEEAEMYLRGLLTEIRNEEGKSMMKWALKNDWASSIENWRRMVGGTLIMNARTIKDISFGGQPPPLEDIMLNIAIGAFINRKGAPRVYDIGRYRSDINRLRSNLKILGVDTNNAFESNPSLHVLREAHINPLNNDPALREIVEFAESLGLNTNSFENINIELQGKTSARTSNEDLTLFKEFHKYLASAGNKKYVKLIDSISEFDAMQIEGKLRKLVGKDATATTLRKYFKANIDLTVGRIETEIAVSAFDIGKVLEISGLTSPGHGTIGPLPKNLALDPALENLAKDGKLTWLKGADGKVLEGKEAVSAVTDILIRAENVFELTRSSALKGTDAKGKDNIVTVRAQHIEAIKDILDSRENVINSALGSANDRYKFTFLETESIAHQLRRRKFDQSLGLINNMFDRETELFMTEMYPLLIAEGGVGVLHPNLEAVGGAEIIANASNIRITGTKDFNRTRAAREFLNTIVEILGAKGSFEINPAIKSKEVDIHTIERAMDFMNQKGMPVDVPTLRLLTTEISRRILKQHVEDSKLDDTQLTFLRMGMHLPSGLISYRVIGEGRPVGFAIKKIKLHSKDEELNNAVREYNEYVDKLREDGAIEGTTQNIVSIEKEIIELTSGSKEFISAWELLKNDAILESSKTAREQLNDLITLIEGPERLRDAIAIAAKDNPDKIYEILNILEAEGIIERKVKKNAKTKILESVTLQFTTDSKTKFYDKEIQERIFNTLEKYGINKENIDQIYDILEKSQEIMIDEKFGAGDNKLMSEDTFFKRFFKSKEEDIDLNFDLLNKDNRDIFLDTVIFTKDAKQNKVFRGEEAIDKLMDRMEFPSSQRQEAYDAAVHIIANRLTQIQREVLYYADGSLKTKNVKMTHRTNKLSELLDREIGLDYVYLEGMTTDWVENEYGQLQHRSYSIFQKDADMLPKSIKKSYREAYDTFNNLLEQYQSETMSQRGMTIYRIPGSNYVLGVPMEYHSKVRDAFIKLHDKYIGDATGLSKKKLIDTLKILKDSNTWTSAHNEALDALMFEKMTHGSQENQFLRYVGLDPGHKDIINLASRTKLFFTPNFTPIRKDLLKGMQKSKNYALNRALGGKKDILTKYIDKDGFGMVTWNDEIHGDIETRVNNLLPTGITWANLLGNRESASGFDSITFINRDMADFLSVYTGNTVENFGNGAKIFKPVINSNGDGLWFFGKTVFVHDPYLQRTFFDKHRDVDLMTTASSDKLKSQKGRYFEKPIIDMPNAGREEVRNSTYNLPLESIGIKDVPKSDAPARFSQSLVQNYMESGVSSQEIFDVYFDSRLDKGMELIRNTLSNPLYERIMIQRIKGIDGGNYENMEMRTAAAQNQGLFLDYINHSKYATAGPFGENMLMNILQNQFLTPSLAPYSYFEYGGQRYDYGAKSVMIQSLNPRYRDLAPTVVDNQGNIKQYGEIVLPYHIRKMPIEIPGKDMEVQIINTKTNETIIAKEWYMERILREQEQRPEIPKATKEEIEASWEVFVGHEEPLGLLHDFVKAKTGGDFQLAVVSSRYPRTRPNDLAILRLREFLNPEHGNGVIVNDFDVLNIFEGDYDYDKADYFWLNNSRVYKHIKESKRHWVHTVDVDRINPSTPPVELLSNNPVYNQKQWSRHNGNNLVMGDFARGMAQGTVGQVNHVRNMGSIDKLGNHVLMETPDGSKVIVDWDNQEWFMRHAFESQHILDHKMGVDKEIMNNMFEWRSDYLFPLKDKSYSKEDFRGSNGEWDPKLLNDFIDKKSKGVIDKRIRIFRKFDKDKKEIELSEIDKDIIKIMMEDYNQLLNLTPGRQTNSSDGRRRATYEDYINVSNEYFNNYANLDNYIFGRLRNLRDRNPDGSLGAYKYNRNEGSNIEHYFKMKENVYKHAQNRKKRYDKKRKDTDPPFEFGEGDKYYWFTGDKGDSPFPMGVLNNGVKRYVGEEGSLIERAMNKIWRENPLQPGDKIVLSGDRYAIFENLERQILGNERFNFEEIGAMLPSIIHDVNKAKSEILRLKYTAARVASNTRMSKVNRTKALKKLNEQIAEYEKQIEPLLTKEYLKSKKAKDLGSVNLVQISHNKDIIEATVQKFVLHELGQISGGVGGEQYWKSIGEVRQRIGKEYGEYFDFASFKDFKERSIMDAEKIANRVVRRDPAEIEKSIENMMTEYVAKYGIRWLYDFAQPKANPVGTIGIFGGRVSPIALKKSTNYKRALQWLLKVHKGLIEGRQTQEDKMEAGIILKNWQRLHFIHTNRLHGNSRNIPMSEIEWFHNLRGNNNISMLPEVPEEINALYNDYSTFNFDRKIDHMSPWGMGYGRDNTMAFFRTLFELKGDREAFESYSKELSYIDQLLAENGYMHPTKYFTLMKGLEGPINEIVQALYKGTINVANGTASPIMMNKLKQNPLYWIIGGSRFQGTDGITLNPAKMMNDYNNGLIDRIIRQAQSITTETPRGNEFNNFFENNKIEGTKC